MATTPAPAAGPAAAPHDIFQMVISSVAVGRRLAQKAISRRDAARAQRPVTAAPNLQPSGSTGALDRGHLLPRSRSVRIQDVPVVVTEIPNRPSPIPEEASFKTEPEAPLLDAEELLKPIFDELLQAGKSEGEMVSALKAFMEAELAKSSPEEQRVVQQHVEALFQHAAVEVERATQDGEARKDQLFSQVKEAVEGEVDIIKKKLQGGSFKRNLFRLIAHKEHAEAEREFNEVIEKMRGQIADLELRIASMRAAQAAEHQLAEAAAAARRQMEEAVAAAERRAAEAEARAGEAEARAQRLAAENEAITAVVTELRAYRAGKEGHAHREAAAPHEAALGGFGALDARPAPATTTAVAGRRKGSVSGGGRGGPVPMHRASVPNIGLGVPLHHLQKGPGPGAGAPGVPAVRGMSRQNRGAASVGSMPLASDDILSGHSAGGPVRNSLSPASGVRKLTPISPLPEFPASLSAPATVPGKSISPRPDDPLLRAALSTPSAGRI